MVYRRNPMFDIIRQNLRTQGRQPHNRLLDALQKYPVLYEEVAEELYGTCYIELETKREEAGSLSGSDQKISEIMAELIAPPRAIPYIKKLVFDMK